MIFLTIVVIIYAISWTYCISNFRHATKNVLLIFNANGWDVKAKTDIYAKYIKDDHSGSAPGYFLMAIFIPWFYLLFNILYTLLQFYLHLVVLHVKYVLNKIENEKQQKEKEKDEC